MINSCVVAVVVDDDALNAQLCRQAQALGRRIDELFSNIHSDGPGD